MTEPGEPCGALPIRSPADHMLEGLQIISPDFRYRYVNAAAAAHGRTTPEKLIGREISAVFPGIETTPMFARLRSSMEKREPAQLVNEFTYPDGSRGWFELRFEPVPDGLAILSIDITERVRAEKTARGSSRALELITSAGRAMARAESEEAMFRAICGIAVERGGYALAWYGVREFDADCTVRPAAIAGRDDGYVSSARITWADSERGRGPTGRAIRTGEAVIARAIAAERDFAPWREDASRRGFGSSIALPVIVDGSCVGALNLYALETDAFDPEERRLLADLARDVGQAVTRVRDHAGRVRAEADVVRLNAVLRGIREVGQLILRERDPDALLRHAAESLVRWRGFLACSFVKGSSECVRVVADGGGDGSEALVRELSAEGSVPACVRQALGEGTTMICTPDGADRAACPVAAGGHVPGFALAIPLRRGERQFGAMLVTLPAGVTIDGGETALLEEVAADLAFALQSIEDERERQHVEAELARSQARMRASWEHLPGAIYLLAPRHDRFILTEWNVAAGQLASASAGRTVGADADALLDGVTDLTPWLRSCQGTRRALRREVESAVPDSSEVRCLVLTVAALPDDGVILHVEDVTTVRHYEERLRLTQKLDSLGRLAGGIAHDFNNLLSVILNCSEFAIEQLPPENPARADVEEVRRAGESAVMLTRQLLAFSRRGAAPPQVVSLNRIVRDFAPMLRRLVGPGVHIDLHLDEPRDAIRADPGQIEQILMNLAVNARDAMPGGGRIAIATAGVEIDDVLSQQVVVETPGPHVVLSLSDTGTGMDPETRQRIFEPFFTTKPEGKGTGLGLPTVYWIVRSCGGAIWLDSESGRGTVFKLYFPRADQAPAELGARERLELPRGTETVLVAEDDVGVRNLAERVLLAAGYRVLTASDGRHALDVARSHPEPIHLLLADLSMPRMGGLDLFAHLSEQRPGVRALFMSGRPPAADGHEGAHPAAFLPKPFTSPMLARAVRARLDGAPDPEGQNGAGWSGHGGAI